MPVKYLGPEGLAEVAVMVVCHGCRTTFPIYYCFTVETDIRQTIPPNQLTEAFVKLSLIGKLLGRGKIYHNVATTVSSIATVLHRYVHETPSEIWAHFSEHDLSAIWTVVRDIAEGLKVPVRRKINARREHALFLGRMLQAFSEQNRELRRIFQGQVLYAPSYPLVAPGNINGSDSELYFIPIYEGASAATRRACKEIRDATYKVAEFMDVVRLSTEYRPSIQPTKCPMCRIAVVNPTRPPKDIQLYWLENGPDNGNFSLPRFAKDELLSAMEPALELDDWEDPLDNQNIWDTVEVDEDNSSSSDISNDSYEDEDDPMDPDCLEDREEVEVVDKD